MDELANMQKKERELLHEQMELLAEKSSESTKCYELALYSE